MEPAIFFLMFLFLLILVINAVFVLLTACGAFFLLCKDKINERVEDSKPVTGAFGVMEDPSGKRSLLEADELERIKKHEMEVNKLVEEWTLT